MLTVKYLVKLENDDPWDWLRKISQIYSPQAFLPVLVQEASVLTWSSGHLVFLQAIPRIPPVRRMDFHRTSERVILLKASNSSP